MSMCPGGEVVCVCVRTYVCECVCVCLGGEGSERINVRKEKVKRVRGICRCQ